MILENYINDLLYRYDCVIVPNFGGFVTNNVGAKLNKLTNTFYPPKKQITFNSYLKHNDGLLANYIASNRNISFEDATKFIATGVAEWKKEIETTSVKIASIGSLSLNDEKQLIFEPNASSNFLVTSFGLSTVESPSVKRFKQQVKPLPIVTEEKQNKAPLFIKRAAVAAILVGFAYAGWNGVQNNEQKELLASEGESTEKKIQSATFVIDPTLPTINLNIEKEETKSFHIIAGAFQEIENAEKKLAELKVQGYDAKIVGKNRFGLTQVSFTSFDKKEEARVRLKEIQETINQDAWLLVK